MIREFINRFHRQLFTPLPPPPPPPPPPTSDSCLPISTARLIKVESLHSFPWLRSSLQYFHHCFTSMPMIFQGSVKEAIRIHFNDSWFFLLKKYIFCNYRMKICSLRHHVLGIKRCGNLASTSFWSRWCFQLFPHQFTSIALPIINLPSDPPSCLHSIHVPQI